VAWETVFRPPSSSPLWCTDNKNKEETMKHNQSGSENLTANQNSDPQPASIVGPQAVWHRPTIRIIDLKRTMFGIGAYFDGVNLSTFSQ
jgi:hypothetical protein